MGKQFCLTMLEFNERDQWKFNQAYEELNMMYPKSLEGAKDPTEFKSWLDEDS